MSRLLLVLCGQCDSVLLWMPQFFSVDFLHVAVLPLLINSLPFEFHLRRTSSLPASAVAESTCTTPSYRSDSHMTGSCAGVYIIAASQGFCALAKHSSIKMFSWGGTISWKPGALRSWIHCLHAIYEHESPFKKKKKFTFSFLCVLYKAFLFLK